MTQKKLTNTPGEYSVLSNIIYVLKGAWRWRKSALFYMGLRIFAMGAESYVPLLVTKFVIDGIESGRTIREFLVVVAAVALFQMVMSLTKSLQSYQLWHRTEYIGTRFELQRIEKIHSMDYELLESQQIQDLVKRAEDGAGGIYSLLNYITTFGFHVFKMLLALTIIFTASPWIILLVIFFSVIRYLISDRTKKWVKEHIDNENIAPRRKQKYYDSVTRDFKYGKDIRLFHMADRLYGGLKNVQTEIFERKNKGRRKYMLADYANMTLELFIQTGIMYAWMVYKVLASGMSIGNFTLYVGSVRRFGGAVSNIFSDLVSFRDSNRRLNDFRAFMEYPDSLQEQTEVIKLPEAETYTFSFEHVWFRYPGHEEYVLKDVSITIEGGKRLAVVGPNGAGKSTFIKLLCRLYRPAKGRILVNGVDIWKVDQQQYFQLLAPVFQNVESYAASIAQNVSLQPLWHTDKCVAQECLNKAGLSNKLDELPNGVDTQLLRFLYEDGIDLSGGEKQKLSFARALYKAAQKETPDKTMTRAKVFVLDEPTAALDPLAEYRMYTGFNELIGGNTAVYISHRLSSTRFCHQVALFEEGQLQEYGSHEELLALGGRYARLYQVQARYYQEQEGGAEHE
ncbi:MAG: ABC transporter ATP-binding protein [Lachnospiraceae bacterium]|nr:ABC transporter ATP-binding protein [Lachnospiraceae bacterium]